MFCQLENNCILLVSSTRIMIVFEFRKIRRCLAQTTNPMNRFYIMQIAKFLQQLGYIIFEPILISIQQNLVFAWCKIWCPKFQCAQGIVWFFWILKLWCFKIAKWSKERCIRVGKASKSDIFKKMYCWKYGRLWLFTWKSPTFFFQIWFKEDDAPGIFCCFAVGKWPRFSNYFFEKITKSKSFLPPPPLIFIC